MHLGLCLSLCQVLDAGDGDGAAITAFLSALRPGLAARAAARAAAAVGETVIRWPPPLCLD